MVNRIDWKNQIDNILNGKLNVCLSTNSSLREWIIKKDYLEYKCDICNLSEWNGKELVLDLDHIDGNRNNNKLENLRFLCPNCHSQTKTYRGRNIQPRIPLIHLKDEIIELYNKGLSISKLVKKLGYSGGKNYLTVKNILEENNIELRIELRKNKNKNKNKNKKLISNSNIIKRELISNSNINFSKKTWGVEVAKLLDCSPQYALKFVKDNLPHLIEENKLIKVTRKNMINNRIKLYENSNLNPNDENFYQDLGDLYGVSKWTSKRFYNKYIK